MSRPTGALVLVLLATSLLAGCLGAGGFGSDSAPRAVVSFSPVPGQQDTYVFDASGSTGRGLSYAWDFDDGTTSDEVRVEHHFRYGDNVYTVRLVVSDNAGTLDVWEQEITVGTGVNRPPVALFDVDARNYVQAAPVRVDASASFDPDTDPLRFRWDFNHLIDFEEYEAFRAAKKAAVEGLEEGGSGMSGGTGSGGGSPQGAPGLLGDASPGLDPSTLLGDKHLDHGGGEGGDACPTSLISHVVETEDPVYTFEAGYQDATCFFIRLQVWDIKGGHETIVSEEIWPVEVWTRGQFPDSTISGSKTGNFSIGVAEALEEVVEGLPELEGVTYETEFAFDVPWPVAQSVNVPDYVPGGVITLTWEAESDGLIESELELNITTPGGMVLGASSSEGSIQLELHGQDDYQGDDWDDVSWQVHIIARSGLNIEWSFEYSIQLDTNPFAEYEQ